MSGVFADMVTDLAADADIGEQVTYTGAGLAEPKSIAVIWLDERGQAFEGPGNTVRQVGAEIAFGDLPDEPGKSDRLARLDGSVWKPQQVEAIAAIARWRVTLERVS